MTARTDFADHDNPLLRTELPIPFDRIQAEHVVPAVRAALSRAEAELEAIVTLGGERTYENTVLELEEVSERMGRVTRPVSHLIGVHDTPELRAAWQEMVPEISAFNARIALNPGLWSAVKAYADTEAARALTGVRARHLKKMVRAFVRAGADLPDEAKSRIEALRVELSSVAQKFANNVLDATNAFELVVTDEAELEGLPESARAQARAAAQAKGVEGWRFTLQIPSFQPFLQYSARRDLRRRMYEAYSNRASSGEHDNRPLIRRLLELRRELAGVLGFRDWAEYTLEESMAGSGDRAIAFEEDLTARTRPAWNREIAALREFARDELGMSELEPWDVSFAAERMRLARFDLDAEALRPYFPLDRVLEGLFEIAHRLFGVTVQPRELAAVWHPDVRFYDVADEGGNRLGGFYTDWFPREDKRGGAWMSGMILGGPRAHGWEPHLGFVAANVSPPEGDHPALLTHREVQTVFHEFGHLLHHMLSRVEIGALGGTRVPTDWVELPSQIMENWTWERPALDLFARHWQTGEPIPDALFDRMRAARIHMGAHHQMRQLSFGTVDLELHARFDPASGEDPVARAQRVMEDFSLAPRFARDHFITSFAHIFSGGYAAGYYSYLWSEVLEADAFSRFATEGLFNRETGRAYVEHVLSQGDAEDPAELFRRFMGRDPDPEALLRRNLGVDAAA
ncbi:M3 family metallopeptidase [Longimicrobium terrae]|uniref:oligopeptidase A n=1 Tax=Longimicrobium terrae TaxID=1639882 RepID=A0A841GY42_9BACT|nr:M3 family metallopeptidase [Longimicrobium terrae]MBB4636272.1 oligopeptidase A [Longimicrobium terrae]MBB6070667.1 oligopeptidase A [Longimicrobium terrae]NNC29650.1 M3 family metallopeptidase [Longimicrobium terrae]